MRTWVVTANDSAGRFIDQRRIDAKNQSIAEQRSYEWISSVGGNFYTSKIEELR